MTARKVIFGWRRPDLALRKLRGLEVMEISLDEIGRYLGSQPTIVEAGAAQGNDTVRLAARWPTGLVHAFEPVPAAYDAVVQRVAGLANVRTYQLALSDHVGTAAMHVSSHPDGGFRPDSSSLLTPTGHVAEFPEVAFEQVVDVPVTTLDEWAAREGVDRVDFLWLDLQGMELRALKASPRVLGSATAICLEVMRTELYAGHPLYAELLDWMKGQGFRVAIDRVGITFGNVLFVRP